jgi:hypothetical protein
MASFDGIGEVFYVQLDTKSRLEVAVQHHWPFRF